MKLAWDSKRKQAQLSGKYVRDTDCPYYNTARWHKASRLWRDRYPLCAECLRQGRIVAAEVVDHIEPWPICKDYFFDESNFQSLCSRCNNEKGQRDKKKIQEWRKSHAAPQTTDGQTPTGPTGPFRVKIR